MAAPGQMAALRLLVVVSGLLWLVSVGSVATVPYGFLDEEVVSGFSYPTDMCFLPGGDLIVQEKNGVVRLVRNRSIQSIPFLDISAKTNSWADRGMLSCLVDKQFGRNRFVYFAYTVDSGGTRGGPQTGQIVRYAVNGAGTAAQAGTELVVLGSVTGIGCSELAVTEDVICCDSFTHCNGGLDMDDDGHLWISLGDGAFPTEPSALTMRSQQPESLNGKLLRVDRTGRGVVGNPYYRSGVRAMDNIAKVWAIGLRNGWRLHHDDEFGVPWIGEVGWATFEEVNLGRKNGNLEWPCKQGKIVNSQFSSYAACKAVNGGRPIDGELTPPVFDYGRRVGTSAGPAQRFDVPGWPSVYRNWVYFTDYSGSWMKRLRVNGAGEVIEGPIDFATGLDGPVQTRLGLEGESIWYLSLIGQSIRRIRYERDTATPRVASLTPPNGATNIESSAVIEVVFSKLVEESSLAGSIRVQRKSGVSVLGGSISFDPARFLARFTPSSQLAELTQYRVDIAGVKDPDGRTIAASTTTFTTGSAETVFVSNLPFKVMVNGLGPAERDQHNGGAAANDGELIALRGEEFAKGLGVSPRSRVVIDIPSGCSRFQSSAGIDDGATSLDCGAAFFEVYADSALLFDHDVVQRPSSTPLEIDVDVGGRRELELIVLDGGCPNGNRNRASWAGARLRCGSFDSVAPRVTLFVPSHGTTKVSVEPTLRVRFSEMMDEQTLFTAIRLRHGATEVGWVPVVNGQITMVTLKVDALRYDTTYEILVGTSARDLAGNRLMREFSASFTTEPAPPYGNTVYISDLTPFSTAESSPAATYETTNGPFEIARRAGRETTYAKGLGMKAWSRAFFDLPEDCTAISTVFGVDAVAGSGLGSCQMEIRGRQRNIYVSGPVNGSSGPVSAQASLQAGETVLRFIAKSGGDGAENDFCDFADAKLTCAGGDVYISELTPTQTQGRVVMDGNAWNGRKLSFPQGIAAPASYARGVRVTPRMVLQYNVPGACSALISDAGVDVGARSGTMRFEVRVDKSACGRTTRLMIGDGPQELRCDTSSASTVSLVAYNGGDGRSGDVGVFGNPRLDCAEGTTRPQCEIDPIPADFRVGDELGFSVEGYDFLGKVLPRDRFRLRVILHHCQPVCHVHEQLVIEDRKAGSFEIPDHGDYFYVELECTVCDGGECATSSSNVYPQTAELTVTTVPGGLEVGVDAQTGEAPLTTTIVVGSTVALSATTPQSGLTFDAWSHRAGAAAQTSVVVRSASAVLYTANFS